MTADEFEFVAAPPAPDRGRNALYARFNEAVKARPGEWAKWPKELASRETAQRTAANLLRGNSPRWPRGEYEAVSSGTNVYVRYIGGGDR